MVRKLGQLKIRGKWDETRQNEINAILATSNMVYKHKF